MARPLVLLCTLLAAAPAAATTTMTDVYPAPGSELPRNARLWAFANSDSNHPPVDVTIVQGDVVRTFKTENAVLDGFYLADLTPLEGGEVEVTFEPPDGIPFTFAYTVTDTDDTTAPTVEPPTLTTELRDFAGRQLRFVTATATTFDDDHQVVGLRAEFDSRRGPTGVPTPDPWESDGLIFVERQTGLDDDGQLGDREIYDANVIEACARLIAIDIAGQETTSEMACITLEPPSPLDPLVEVGETLGLPVADCSCTVAGSRPPVGVGMAVLWCCMACWRRRC